MSDSRRFSDEELDALEAKCDASIPGPWYSNPVAAIPGAATVRRVGSNQPIARITDNEVEAAEDYDNGSTLDLAAFIAAASPDVVSGLVAALREARAALFTDAAEVAEVFHRVYEELAPRHGWETNEKSRKTWADVPPENKTLMVATALNVMMWLRRRGGLEAVEAAAALQQYPPARSVLGAQQTRETNA